MGKKSVDLAKKDLERIWHPCTYMKDYENPPLIPIKKVKKFT